jgi:hypothetical protein
MTDKTEAMDKLIAQDADLIEIRRDDLVQRLRDGHVCSIAQNSCRNGYAISLAADRIEALTAENFKLAAGSCDVEGGKVGDEHGHFYCTLQNKVEAQAAEIERLREALHFYAEAKNWAYVKSAGCNCIDADGGDTARTALDARGWEIREKRK